MEVRIYDLSWDEGPDYQGVYARGFLVEAMERIVDEACSPEDIPCGRPTGEYILADHSLPSGCGVLIKGAEKPLYGTEAEKVWDRRVRALTDFEEFV